MNQEIDLNNLHQAGDDSDTFVSSDSETLETEKNPKQEFEDLKKAFDELDDKYKRLWADQQNMMNRVKREREDLYKYAATGTIENLLPAIDNFEFAKKSINEQMELPEILKSIDMLKSQLMMALQAAGLEEIKIEGVFNPELHEAISKVQDSEKAEGSIIEILKPGYRFKDKILRPATVIVSTKE